MGRCIDIYAYMYVCMYVCGYVCMRMCMYVDCASIHWLVWMHSIDCSHSPVYYSSFIATFGTPPKHHSVSLVMIMLLIPPPPLRLRSNLGILFDVHLIWGPRLRQYRQSGSWKDPQPWMDGLRCPGIRRGIAGEQVVRVTIHIHVQISIINRLKMDIQSCQLCDLLCYRYVI